MKLPAGENSMYINWDKTIRRPEKVIYSVKDIEPHALANAIKRSI
jgi:hypothetical protein